MRKGGRPRCCWSPSLWGTYVWEGGFCVLAWRRAAEWRGDVIPPGKEHEDTAILSVFHRPASTTAVTAQHPRCVPCWTGCLAEGWDCLKGDVEFVHKHVSNPAFTRVYACEHLRSHSQEICDAPAQFCGTVGFEQRGQEWDFFQHGQNRQDRERHPGITPLGG